MARAPRVELVEGEEVDGEAVCVRRRTPARARDARVSVSRDGQSEALSAKRARATRCSRVGCGGRHQENELVDRGNRRRRERPPVSTGQAALLTRIPKPRQNPRSDTLGRHLRRRRTRATLAVAPREGSRTSNPARSTRERVTGGADDGTQSQEEVLEEEEWRRRRLQARLRRRVGGGHHHHHRRRVRR